MEEVEDRRCERDRVDAVEGMEDGLQDRGRKAAVKKRSLDLDDARHVDDRVEGGLVAADQLVCERDDEEGEPVPERQSPMQDRNRDERNGRRQDKRRELHAAQDREDDKERAVGRQADDKDPVVAMLRTRSRLIAADCAGPSSGIPDIVSAACDPGRPSASGLRHSRRGCRGPASLGIGIG